MKDDGQLVWLQLDLSDDPEDPTIVGIASAVTDASLSAVTHGPELRCDTAEARAEAQTATVTFLEAHVTPGAAPLAGDNTFVSRVALQKQMPELAALVHYRSVDLATLHRLVERWHPDAKVPNDGKARGKDALVRSIEVLRRYRASVFI